MDLNASHHFFRALEDDIRALGIETTYIKGAGSQIGDTLRILLPVTEEGHPVVTEIMLTGFTEDVDLMIIYSTVITRFNEKLSELQEKLSEWNLLCPLGAYGIYAEEEQLFHKYTDPFPREIKPEELAAEAMLLLELIFAVLSDKYPEILKYSR